MSEDLTFAVDLDPDPAEIAVLLQGLNDYAAQLLHGRGFHPLALFARSSSGEIKGGIYGSTNWNWLEINYLWVAAEHRQQGIGSQLLGKFEEIARERGCRYSHLDTFSFQAKPFYERQGYTVFAILEDYPPDHCRYYLRKQL